MDPFDRLERRAASSGSSGEQPHGVPSGTHIVPVAHRVSRVQRERRNRHRGAVFWLTGLPASGKSTLAMRLEQRLFEIGCQTYVLDGDNVRKGLNSDLSFSAADRSENLRRVAEVAKLIADAGLACIVAFISPMRGDRRRAREITATDFHEIYIKASLAACEARDPKGHYKLARAGQIAEFSGMTAPYEIPLDPDLVIDTERDGIETCVASLFQYTVRCLNASGSMRAEVEARGPSPE
jgi:bifunctional enzyme CysN/CysC